MQIRLQVLRKNRVFQFKPNCGLIFFCFFWLSSRSCVIEVLTFLLPFHWDLIFFQTQLLPCFYLLAGERTKNGGKSGFLCIFVSFTLHTLLNYFALTIFLEPICTLCADFYSNQQIFRFEFLSTITFDRELVQFVLFSGDFFFLFCRDLLLFVCQWHQSRNQHRGRWCPLACTW